MLTRTRLVECLFVAGLCAVPASHAADEPPTGKAHTLSANATFATDYLFRGISQTMSDPAVHAEFVYSHNSGFFAGIWGSNVDSGDSGPEDDEADLEIDLYLGYGASLSDDWAVDITAIRYIFPHTAAGFDLDWNEFQLGLHYRDYLSFQVAYSNEVFNLEDPGYYYGLSGNYPLPGSYPLADQLRLTASLGYSDLDDALDDSYIDWSLGVEADMGMFTTRLAWVDTDGSAEDLFGSKKTDGGLFFSITAEFSQ